MTCSFWIRTADEGANKMWYACDGARPMALRSSTFTCLSSSRKGSWFSRDAALLQHGAAPGHALWRLQLSVVVRTFGWASSENPSCLASIARTLSGIDASPVKNIIGRVIRRRTNASCTFSPFNSGIAKSSTTPRESNRHGHLERFLPRNMPW